MSNDSTSIVGMHRHTVGDVDGSLNLIVVRIGRQSAVAVNVYIVSLDQALTCGAAVCVVVHPLLNMVSLFVVVDTLVNIFFITDQLV